MHFLFTFLIVIWNTKVQNFDEVKFIYSSFWCLCYTFIPTFWSNYTDPKFKDRSRYHFCPPVNQILAWRKQTCKQIHWGVSVSRETHHLVHSGLCSNVTSSKTPFLTSWSKDHFLSLSPDPIFYGLSCHFPILFLSHQNVSSIETGTCVSSLLNPKHLQQGWK